MAFYNRTTSVNAGSTTNLSIKNRIKKLKEQKSQDDPANVVIDASNAADIWKQVYSGESIDVLEAGTIKIMNEKFNYAQEKAAKTEDKRVTQLMNRLHNNGIFQQISTGALPEEIMDRAIDFNDRISFSTQSFADNNSSFADMKKSYKHLKQVQENKGKVFIFDTETIGGKNTSGIWQPTAITEFAMQEIDYATGETKKTNIVMGVAPTKKNQELLDTVEELIREEKWSVIESNEQYAVTAKRMALYADAKIIQTSEGYSIIESLPDSDTVKWKNIDTFKKGRKALESAYNDSKTLDNGLKVAEDMFIKSLTKMHTELEAGNASLVGQNFVDFDMRIANMQLLEMKDMYKTKFDKAGKGAAEYAKAFNTVNQAMKKIGGGFTVKNEHAFDTLTLFSAVREYFGVDTLLNNRRDIIQKAAGRTARQEHVGAAWFVEEFENAMAHMADFDVDVLGMVLNKPLDQLNGSTLLDYFMTGVIKDNKYLPNNKTNKLFTYKGLDLTSLMNDEEKEYLFMNAENVGLVQESLQKVYNRSNINQGLMSIDTGNKMINSTTIYRAKSGTSAKEYQGKGLLNFTYNKTTGEVFTAAGYNSINNKFMGYSSTAVNMGTNIRQGGFYIVDAMGKLNIDDIDPEIRKLLPDNSSPELFHVKMRRLVNGDNAIIDNLDDVEYNYFFNSEKEVGAWFANHMQDIATTHDGETLTFNEDNMDLIRKASPEYANMSNDKLIDLAVRESNEAFLTDKVFNNIINSENSELKRITGILETKKYLEEHNLTDLTGEDISKLIRGESLETISEEQAKKFQKGIVKKLGFNHRGLNEQVLYSNTANYMAYAYDNITSQDKFLNQVLENFNAHTAKFNYSTKEREVAFHDLMEVFRIQAASYLNTDDNKEYYRAVTGTRKHINTVAENKRYYDVRLPDDFLEVKTRTRSIVSAANPEEYKNVLRLDLERNNPVFDLVNKVTKAVYSDKKIYGDSGMEQRKAMRKFVDVLMNDEMISSHDMAGKLNDLVSQKEFGVHHAAGYIIDMLKDIKSVNAEAGIIKEVNERTLEMSEELLDVYNNKLTLDNNIKKTIEAQGRVYDFSFKKKDEISKFVKNNLISFYMPDWQEFKKSIANRTDDQKWIQEVLYNNLSESITNHLTDIIHTTSKIQGANVLITPSGQIVAKKGQDVIPINLPKVLNKNGTLVGQLGSQRLNLNLKLSYTSNGKGAINTNLGELFNFKSAVGTSVEKSIEEGKFVFGDLERYIARVSKQFREESVHSGTAGDYLSNYVIDVKNFNKQIPEIFHISGGYRNILDKSIIPQEIINTVRDKIAQGADFSEGEIDPALNLQIAPYKIDLIKSLEESRGNTGTDFYKVVSGLTTGVKDKSKAGKDKYIGANTRFQVGFWNPGDDNSRPVIYSAGNVKYFAKENIDNMVNKSVGSIMEGSIFESLSMNDSYINRITADGVGQASSSFTGKIAYLGQLAIDELLKNKAEEVIEANKELFGSREETEKAYNRLYGLISTYEQAKVFSATDFENLTGGVMAADIQRLSIAKDISIVADNADPDKLARLLNLRGQIVRGEDGRLQYKSKTGHIVKRGENVVEYAGFGGSNGHWVSKFNKGVLGYSVYNSQNMRLTDKKISDILNENASFFEGIDLANPAEYMPIFDRVIESLDMKAMFTIEDINKTTLPKIMANDAEKSMNQLLYGKIGTIDENIEKVLRAYGDETAELIGASVPTPQALRAFFTDEELLNEALKAGKFESYDAFEKAVEIEGLKLDKLIFGKKGVLPGFQAIGNDNLVGHKNKATMLAGSLGSAVEALGKYFKEEGSDENTLHVGMRKLVEIVNKSIDEDDGKLSLFTSKRSGQESKHVKLKFENGHLYMEGGQYLEQGLDNYDVINVKGAENLYRYIDDMLEKHEKTSGISIPKSNRLVHIDKEGKEFVGSILYAGDNFAGSYGYQTMKVINDSEVKSGMPSEYINTLKEIKDLKKQRENLYKEIRRGGEQDSLAIAKLGLIEEKLKQLEGLARDFEEVGHLYSFGIQEMNLLNQYRLSKDSEEIVKRNMARGLYKDKDVVQNLESLKGLDKDYFNKSRKVFQFVEDELTKEMYYNPLTEDKLTKKMIKSDEYKHLADIYHEYKDLGIALGNKSAQDIFDLRTASLAESFNNSNGLSVSKDELVNKYNFKELTPEEFLKSYGDPDLMDFDSVVKQNVVLNLGEEFGSNQYVAVPGMGSIVGKETIKQDWHRKAGALSAFYVDEYANLEGVDPKEAMETIIKRADDIKASTSEFVTKGGALHERSKRRIQTQNIRLKIMNTGDSEFNHLLKQAHIDGYSLKELHEAGVHYDYAFDTIETFKDLGYFDKDVLDELGLASKEEAIAYYKKHGVVDVDDRFPNIIRTSMMPVTHFLNTDEQATNAVYFASHTNLKMNADSDGDSATRIHLPDLDGTEYNIYRKKRLDAIELAKTMNFETNLEREAFIKQTILDSGVSNKAYDAFKDVDVFLSMEALKGNQNWYNRARNTLKDDAKKTKEAQIINVGGKSTIAEVSDGKSILGRQKLLALNVDPTALETKENLLEVNNMLELIDKNRDIIKGMDDGEKILNTLSEGNNILKYGNESEALDRALTALEYLKDSGKVDVKVLNNHVFDSYQDAAIKRIRIGNYYSEMMSKVGITATGNVNATLYGITQTAKVYYGNENLSTFDNAKRLFIETMNYEIEQSPISSKKLIVKAGDTRLMDFTDLMRDFKQKGMGRRDDEESIYNNLYDWMSTYMDKGKIVKQYENILQELNLDAKYVFDPKTQKDEIADYMITRWLNTTNELYTNPVTKDNINIYSAVGRNKATPLTVQRIAGSDFNSFLDRAIADTSGIKGKGIKPPPTIEMPSAEKENIEKIAKEVYGEMKTKSNKKLDEVAGVVSGKLTKPNNTGAALALGAVGLATGLIAAGYASGNPLRDANPETVAKEQTAPKLSFGPDDPQIMPNNTGGYIINIKGDTSKGNRQLKRAMRQAAKSSTGGNVNINMSLRTSKAGGYDDKDIENILNDYF